MRLSAMRFGASMCLLTFMILILSEYFVPGYLTSDYLIPDNLTPHT